MKRVDQIYKQKQLAEQNDIDERIGTAWYKYRTILSHIRPNYQQCCQSFNIRVWTFWSNQNGETLSGIIFSGQTTKPFSTNLSWPQGRSVLKPETKKILEMYVVELAQTEWAWPIRVAYKKERTPRLCWAHKLNAVTIWDLNPMSPRAALRSFGSLSYSCLSRRLKVQSWIFVHIDRSLICA